VIDRHQKCQGGVGASERRICDNPIEYYVVVGGRPGERAGNSGLKGLVCRAHVPSRWSHQEPKDSYFDWIAEQQGSNVFEAGPSGDNGGA